MPVNHRRTKVAALAAALTVAACVDEPVSPIVDAGKIGRSAAPNAATDESILAIMDAVNAQLAAAGADYQVGIAEYITSPEGVDHVGSTLVARNIGNKQLTADFIPFDPRRLWSGPATGPADDITFAIDQTGDAIPVLGGLTAAQATAAIVRGIASWEAVTCSDLPLTPNASGAFDIGVVAFLNGLGGSPFVFADVQNAGFRDINFAGGVLGATFTFVFVNAGVPTDADGNGLADVAFREIYYDPSFPWLDNNVNNIDLESVAVHEMGHGLSQAHFGNIFERNDGTFDASPRAVMNAFYQSPFRLLTGTDNGGHCSNWANWPIN